MDISELALRAQVAWFRGIAAGGFPQISVGEGFAVSTGLDSNTENGAVLAPSVLDNVDQLDALLGWLRDRAVPASVIVTAPLHREAIDLLIGRGFEPELTGHNMGRVLNGSDAAGAAPLAADWQIREVTDARGLRENHRVYADDGWWDGLGELDQRVEVADRLGYGPSRPVRHWSSFHRGIPVGAATSFRFEDAVLLVHCCVASPWRRHRAGTTLTRVRLAAAADQGAVEAVLFPSPDGYHLHRSFAFDLAPVHPNRWFYLR